MLSDVAKFHADFIKKSITYGSFVDFVHQMCVKHYCKSNIMVDVYLYYEDKVDRTSICYRDFVKFIEKQCIIYQENKEVEVYS